MRVMRSMLVGLAVLASGLVANPVLAVDGNPEAGARLANTCLGCHAVPGLRNAYPSYRVPMIGGQNAEYMLDALRAYRDGLRRHPSMNANAGHLTDEQMRDIAAFFSQPR